MSKRPNTINIFIPEGVSTNTIQNTENRAKKKPNIMPLLNAAEGFRFSIANMNGTTLNQARKCSPIGWNARALIIAANIINIRFFLLISCSIVKCDQAVKKPEWALIDGFLRIHKTHRLLRRSAIILRLSPVALFPSEYNRGNRYIVVYIFFYKYYGGRSMG